MITLAFVATSVQIAASWGAIMAAIFLFQIIREGIKCYYRRESLGFAFQRVENVYPKYRL